MTSKIYYCEYCLKLAGKLEIMKDNGLCPKCGEPWKLNRGQARHVVAKRIKHYQNVELLLNAEDYDDI